MIIESLLGSLLGGAFRLAPEVLSFFDKKNERAHELAMLDKNIALDAQQAQEKQAELGIQADMTRMAAGIAALGEALKGQFQSSGIKLIDALNVSVRPVVTYAFFLLYVLVKVGVYVAAIHAGSGWLDAVKPTWTEADMALFSGIINFYFLGRVFDKRAS